MAAVLLLLPLFAFIFANLFMMNIGKVFIDALAGLNHLIATVFILFFIVPLLARDIESRVCYLLLTPPVSRLQYILGRFTGVVFTFFALMLLLILSGTLFTLLLLQGSLPIYHAGLESSTVASLIFFQLFHYLSLIGITFFIFSWATGMAEIMLFTSAVTFFSWSFPPVLAALKSPEASRDMPVWMNTLLDSIYQILPHLNGNQITLMLGHGISVSLQEIAAYCLEHLTYTAAGVILAALFFRRRDL